jgi:pyruvate kinase
LNDQITEVYNESVQILKSKNLVEKGDTLVHVASIPLNQAGNANMIKVTLV